MNMVYMVGYGYLFSLNNLKIKFKCSEDIWGAFNKFPDFFCTGI